MQGLGNSKGQRLGPGGTGPYHCLIRDGVEPVLTMVLRPMAGALCAGCVVGWERSIVGGIRRVTAAATMEFG